MTYVPAGNPNWWKIFLFHVVTDWMSNSPDIAHVITCRQLMNISRGQQQVSIATDPARQPSQAATRPASWEVGGILSFFMREYSVEGGCPDDKQHSTAGRKFGCSVRKSTAPRGRPSRSQSESAGYRLRRVTAATGFSAFIGLTAIGMKVCTIRLEPKLCNILRCPTRIIEPFWSDFASGNHFLLIGKIVVTNTLDDNSIS